MQAEGGIDETVTVSEIYCSWCCMLTWLFVRPFAGALLLALGRRCLSTACRQQAKCCLHMSSGLLHLKGVSDSLDQSSK